MPELGFKPRSNCFRAFALHSKPRHESSGRCLNRGETTFPGVRDHGLGLPQGLPLRSFPLGLCEGCTFPATLLKRSMQRCSDQFRGVSGRGTSGRPGGAPDGTLDPLGLRGRNWPPALAPRPSLNPSNPRGLGVGPSRDPTPRHPPDPVEPSRKHSPAGRKNARSSGLASLCPAHAPPLASGASALALSTLFLIPFKAPTDSLKKNKSSSGDAVVLSTIKDFFRPHTFLKTPRIWVICQPGADSSRRRERRWPDR